MGDVGLNFFEQMKTTPVFTPSRLLAKSLRNLKKKKNKVMVTNVPPSLTRIFSGRLSELTHSAQQRGDSFVSSVKKLQSSKEKLVQLIKT